MKEPKMSDAEFVKMFREIYRVAGSGARLLAALIENYACENPKKANVFIRKLLEVA